MTTDNRLEQAREQQIKELREMQVVRTRDDGERVLRSVARQLRDLTGAGSEGGGLRVAIAQPDARPDARPGASPDARPGASPDARPGASAPGAGAGAADPRSDARNAAELPRLVADFQRQAGLPVTGRLDAGTLGALQDRGLVLPQPAPPAGGPPRQEAARSEPRSEPARAEDVTATRLSRAAAEQRARQRVGDAAPDRATDRARTREPAPSARDVREDRGAPIDRALDPARLLASLALAGFKGQGKGALEEAVKQFQAAQGLPVTGKVDARTQESLAKAGVTEPSTSAPASASTSASSASEPPPKATSDRPVEAKQQVRRALADSAPQTKNADRQADRDVARDPIRPQASTQQQTTSADVAARAPVAAPTAAPADAQRARLDTVLAQQVAHERGVQEGTGDPQAAQGHGDVSGAGAGLQGAGGTSGGGAHDPLATSTAVGATEGPAGDETAVGNARAGDDDFNDARRGNANADGAPEEPADDTHEGDEGDYWRVPPLSEQVRAALEKIVRDDDGSGAVTYTWDVTFLRPGTYASGQPAEELWHVAVHHATAFDPVWQQAADAISSRMLYTEPDGEPPTIDDFILALRRARVR